MKTLLAIAALFLLAGSSSAFANPPAAALFADFILNNPSTAGALSGATGGAGGAGGKGGNSGPLTNQPTTTQNDKTKVDGSVGVGLGQAPGAISGCIGEQRYLWGAVQFAKTIPGGCVEQLAAEAIRSGDPVARAKGLSVLDKFTVEYFGDETQPTVGGDAAFRD